MKLKSTIMLFSVVLFTGCGPTKDQRIAEIAAMEAMLQASTTAISLDKADAMLAKYAEFVEEFPMDTLSARYLYQSGVISANIGECNEAIAFFDEVIQKFPDLGIVANSLLQKGYTYENCLKDTVAAEEAYTAFMQTYPQHPYAKEVEVLLQMLTMNNDLELIRSFEQRNNDSVKKE